MRSASAPLADCGSGDMQLVCHRRVAQAFIAAGHNENAHGRDLRRLWQSAAPRSVSFSFSSAVRLRDWWGSPMTYLTMAHLALLWNVFITQGDEGNNK